MNQKVAENRARRVAERRGLKLVKSRRRDPGALDFGCYALVNIALNCAVFGLGPTGTPFASLEEVEAFLKDYKPS